MEQDFLSFILRKRKQLLESYRQRKWKSDSTKQAEKEVMEQGYYSNNTSLFRSFQTGNKIICNIHENITIATLPHVHDFFEMIYVYRGSITNQVNKENIYLKEGDICLLNPHTIHQLLDFKEESIIINLLIAKDLLEEDAILFNNKNFLHNFLIDCLFFDSRKIPFLYFPAQKNQMTAAPWMLQNMIYEYFDEKTYFQQAMEYYFSLLCIELSRAGMEDIDLPYDIEFSKTAPILQYIRNHLSTATVESTAKAFHYNPTYLPQLLKKTTGKNFREIQLYFRIKAAQKLLRETSLSVDEIILRIGCGNRTYFYKKFQNASGISPREYRIKYSEKIQSSLPEGHIESTDI